MEIASDKFPMLISYAHFRDLDDDLMEWVMGNPDVDIFIDSGAFTVYQTGEVIELKDYLEWLDKWSEHIWGYIALDVVGNPEATEKNLHEMWKAGYDPAPVHVDGDDEEKMDELCERADLVCCAGLPLSSRMTARNRSYMKLKMKWAKDHPVHWLGYTHEGMIRAFQPYSVDSSSWQAMARYGNAVFYLGNGRKIRMRTIDVKKKQIGDKRQQEDIRRFIAKHGLSMKDFMNPDIWSGQHWTNPILEMSVYSWIQYVREISERFSTRYFLAALDFTVAQLYRGVNQVTGSDYPLTYTFEKTTKKKSAKRKLAKVTKTAKVRKRRLFE